MRTLTHLTSALERSVALGASIALHAVVGMAGAACGREHGVASQFQRPVEIDGGDRGLTAGAAADFVRRRVLPSGSPMIMTTLARSFGRVLAQARALLRRVRARLFDAFLTYLTRPIRRDSAATIEGVQSLAGILCRGDVLLSEGNTRVSVLVKCLTQSAWSHVSMYVGPLDDGHDPRCIVEADIAAGVRSIRLSELDALNVRVLRPTGLDSTNRSRLAEWAVSRIGSEYDHAHAWLLGRRLLRLPRRPSLRPSSDTVASTATRFICCTLLTHAFALVGLAITPVQGGSGSPAARTWGASRPGISSGRPCSR